MIEIEPEPIVAIIGTVKVSAVIALSKAFDSHYRYGVVLDANHPICKDLGATMALAVTKPK